MKKILLLKMDASLCNKNNVVGTQGTKNYSEVKAPFRNDFTVSRRRNISTVKLGT